MKRCTGIEFLNQCEYAVLCGNGFGCKYEGECDYQRPKITAHNSDYTVAVKNLINSEVDCVQTKNGAYVNLDGVIDCLNRALHDFA